MTAPDLTPGERSHSRPEGVGTGADEGASGQDTGSAWVTRSADCPEAPAQAHPLTPAVLAAIEARVNAATEGPWIHLEVQDGDECGPLPEMRPTEGWSTALAAAEDIWFNADTPADAEFIAAARTDVPLLLAEVARLRSALDEAENCEAAREREVDSLRSAFAAAERERDLHKASLGDAMREARNANERGDALAAENAANALLIQSYAARAEAAERERDEARAQVGELDARLHSEWHKAERRAEAAEAHVAVVRALADEWERDYPGSLAACNREPDEWWLDLRAALSSVPATEGES